MNTKLFGTLVGAAMLVASSAGAAIFEPAKTMSGTLMALDAKARTVVVGGQTFAVIGSMQDLHQGERVTIAYLGNSAWVTPDR